MPYRKPDFRCEETLSGERCMLTIGHRGPHTIPGGWIWVTAGDSEETRNETKSKAMKRLVKYSEYFGRMGELDGLFIADDDDWTLLERLIKEKQTIYFGEVLGKHSQIYGTLSDVTIEVKSENQEFCNEFERLGLSTGVNPLNYYEED